MKGVMEITGKKRSWDMDEERMTVAECELQRKKNRVDEQMKENVFAMVGETNLNWSQIDQ